MKIRLWLIFLLVWMATATQAQTEKELKTIRVGKDQTECLKAFSPNGDGVNDTWDISCVSRDNQNKVQVYNRWGNIAFEAENYDGSWGGNDLNDDPLPTGVYVYIIEIPQPSGDPERYTGSLTILR